MGGTCTYDLQHAAHIVRYQIRLAILVGIVDRAAGEAPWVVGHDGEALGQQRRDPGKSRSTHGMAGKHERGAGSLYLVEQCGAGNVQLVVRR